MAGPDLMILSKNQAFIENINHILPKGSKIIIAGSVSDAQFKHINQFVNIWVIEIEREGSIKSTVIRLGQIPNPPEKIIVFLNNKFANQLSDVEVAQNIAIEEFELEQLNIENVTESFTQLKTPLKKYLTEEGPKVVKDNYSILIVDDIEMNREVIKVCLEDYKVKIVQAKNGEEALEAFKNVKFDLVLLDFMMPGMNGDEVLSHIREKWNQKEMPVIMVSAQEEMENVKKLTAIGINGYVVKPVDLNILIEKIKLVIPIEKN